MTYIHNSMDTREDHNSVGHTAGVY